jgi:aspartate/methionine/tyrosine aminotransferase
MWFERMTLEVWFDEYQYAVDCDIGESAVKFRRLGDLGIDLGNVPLRYGHHTGLPELRSLLAADYPGLSADEVLVTAGGSEAIYAINASLLRPGDHVIVEHPNYPSLYDIPRGLGAEVSLFPLRFEDGFRPDLDRLEAMITPRTKLVSFTHPNNPTGSMISSAELERLVAITEKHGIHLLFDETYRELNFTCQLPPAATLGPRVISLSTMSKCYGLPGIRIGWMATHDRALLDAVLTAREFLTITNNALGEVIAAHVLRRKREFLERASSAVERNRAIASKWVEGHEHVEWVRPEAGVVGLPRLKDHVKVDPEAVYRRLAREYRTFTIPGRCFELDNRYFRLGFGATEAEIQKGLANFDRALADLV